MSEETEKQNNNLDELTTAFRETLDDDPEFTEKLDKAPAEKKTAKKKTSKKSPTKLKRQSTQQSASEKRNTVDDFLNRHSNTFISDRALVNRFCSEQNKKILLPGDWNVCYKYQVSGNIKDLLEYIHNNIRSRRT